MSTPRIAAIHDLSCFGRCSLTIALPVLSGWQWVAMISPIFVFLLLTRVSGVPMLEKKADKKWGGQDDYEAYKAGTPVLVPLPPGSKRGAGR